MKHSLNTKTVKFGRGGEYDFARNASSHRVQSFVPVESWIRVERSDQQILHYV